MPVPVPRKSSPPPQYARLKELRTFSIPQYENGQPPKIAVMNGHSNGDLKEDPFSINDPRDHSQPTSPNNLHRRKASKPTSNGTIANGQIHPTKEALVVQKIDWEIPRKALHSSIGFGVLYLYSQQPETIQPVVKTLAGALCIIVPADILRLNYPPFEALYEKMLGILMRESEKKSSNGVIWYIIGVIYALSLLPRDIAVASILVLSWCDTAASTVGRKWGHLTPPLPAKTPVLGIPLARKKSLAGFIGAAATGAVVAVAFWGWAVPRWQGYIEQPQWGDVAWKWGEGFGRGVGGGWLGLLSVGVVTGLVAGVAEALDVGKIDDNLSLPVISGTVLYGLSKLASYFIWW